MNVSCATSSASERLRSMCSASLQDARLVAAHELAESVHVALAGAIDELAVGQLGHVRHDQPRQPRGCLGVTH